MSHYNKTVWSQILRPICLDAQRLILSDLGLCIAWLILAPHGYRLD